MAEVTEKTLKDLKAEAIALGIPAEDVESFNTKSQLNALIGGMKAKDATTKEPEKVKAIVEALKPEEEKKVNKVWLGKAEILREKLLKQLVEEPVTFLIPLAPKEKPGKVEWRKDKNDKPYQVVIGDGNVEPVQLNGFKYLVPKGVLIQVPKQVAEVLSKSYRITSEAGRNMLVDRTDPATGMKVSEAL
jgi:hypothetical protein